MVNKSLYEQHCKLLLQSKYVWKLSCACYIVAFRWGWIWQWKFLACFIDFKMVCFHPNHDLVLHNYKLVLMFKYVTKYTLKSQTKNIEWKQNLISRKSGQYVCRWHICMQDHLEILLHELQVMLLLSQMDAKRSKLGFHLYTASIWISHPEMNLGHLSHPWLPPPFPSTTLKIKKSARDLGWNSAPGCTVCKCCKFPEFPHFTSPAPPVETNRIILIRLRRFNS